MNRSSLSHLAMFVLFLGLLVFPWIAGALGASAETVERRAAEPLPELGGDALLESETFGSLNRFVRDRTPLRGTVTGWYNRAWLSVGVSAVPNVVEGPGDTLFLSEDFTEPCKRDYSPDDLHAAFSRWSEAARAGDKEWFFFVAPDKGAVLDHRLDGRSDIAAECGRVVRDDFRSELDRTGVSIDLAASLAAADKDDPGRWYYERDSHWTFDAGSLVAGEIVDLLRPGLWDPTVVGPTGRTLVVRGDVNGRLGLELDDPVDVLGSLRPDVETTRREIDVDGVRTVRVYTSHGNGGLVEGSTVVIHDSMMNFAEEQLAPYFEQITFIHWSDIEKANFFARVASANRVLVTRVERNVHRQLQSMLGATFSDRFDGALRSVEDDALVDELVAGAAALRQFAADTGAPVSEFDDLLSDPGIANWAGPYLDSPIYESGVHPRYGAWKTLQIDSPAPGSPADCAEFGPEPCGSWLLLLDAPESTIGRLDVEVDGGDGFERGRVRRSLPHGILYFYSDPG